MALIKVNTRGQSSDFSREVGRRNLIINGNFSIFQRGAGATTVNGNDVFAADRFKGWANGGGTYTVEQSTDVPNNEFEYSAKLTNTGVDSSVAAGDNYRWATDIEGYNVSQLGYGHSDAKAVTLSFWVKSSLVGTYCGALYSATASRHYIYEYTISSANTWEKKTITVSSGDTTGSWNRTNGNGLRVYWGFGSGSNYQGTTGAWTAGEKWETTNQAAWIGSASATFYITGCQIEVGDIATEFEHRSYAEELSLCSRYYHTSFSGETTIGGSLPANYAGQVFSWCDQYGSSPGRVAFNYQWPVQMRDLPTVTMYGNQWTSARLSKYNGGTAEYTINYASGVSRNGLGGYYGITGTNGDFVVAYVEASAEL